MAGVMLFGVGQASAEEAWVRARSRHFEVISDATPERARTATVRLERFRHVLAEVFRQTPEVDEVPTVVIAFRDQASFAPFLPTYRGRRQDVDGYFQAGFDRDYIAARLGPGDEDADETLFHEYAHVLLNRTLAAQPLWLAEGLAEVFSRWSAADAEALVGLPAPDHVRRLQREALLPLSQVLHLDYTSPLYNEGDQRALFYAESWALAHWVLLGRGETGPADLRVFLAAIAEGTDPEAAFRSAFGLDTPAAERVLAAYVAGAPPAGRFPVAGLDQDFVVETDSPARAAVESRLGDLLLHGGRLVEARRHLERAVESDAGFGPAHAALAEAALRQGRWKEAHREVALALAADPGDAVALYHYAEMLVRETAARGEVLAGEREAEAVGVLERALRSNPRLADACALLARLRPQPYDERIRQVLVALARDPTRADLGLTLADLYARKNDLAAARAVLVRNRTIARDDADRFLSDHLLARLDRFTAGTSERTGTLVALECLSSGSLRFVVAGGGQTLRLDAARADGVFLYGRNGGQLEKTFTCGAQHDPVRARYRPSLSRTASGADGTLMSLIFESR